LSREELIRKASYKSSKKSPAALINIILMKDRKGKITSSDIDSIQAQLLQVETDIRFHIDAQRDINNAYRILYTDFEQQADVDEENRIKDIEYENKKRQIAQEALTDFNRLNQGKIEVARQSNETDDEFLARLQQMGNIFVDPNDMQKQIETEYIRTYE
jgi:hypothetical protein